MALTDFKTAFDNSYQEIFQKVLVAKEIMNTRFEPALKYGESIERVAVDISSVRVRNVTRGSASTIDSVTDSGELLTINLEKEAAFHVSDGEVTQAGPLNPGEWIGSQIAIKVAQDLDARCFAEVLNATYDFDNGDLTTLSSTGTAITLNGTTVPQLVARMGAKLRRANNQLVNTNMVFVVDSYAASDITQYLLGKNIDLAGSTFSNGYTGDVSNAQLYVSENLTGEAVLGLATEPTANDTVVINGITFTFVASPTNPGDVDLGGSADATRANLTALINDPATTTAGGVALSAANQVIIQDQLRLVATNNNTTNKMTIVGTGSGRLILSETFTDATDAWDKNFVHAYFGKKGAIDLVVQDMKPVDMRVTADRRGTNVFSSYLAGVKTFADGAKKFLDVLVNAA
jgi:hypothetical protein